MKRTLIIIMLMLSISISNQVFSQLLGKWVVPVGDVNYPQESILLEFYPTIVQASTIESVAVLGQDNYTICDGAFDPNYDLDYYIVSDYLFYDSQNTIWNPDLGEYIAEAQIIPRPNNQDEFFVFFGKVITNKNLSTTLYYQHIWLNNGSPQIETKEHILNDIEGSTTAFAITEEHQNKRYIYTASEEFMEYIGVSHSAGLRYFEITENGIDLSSITAVLTPSTSTFTEDDFASYNLELNEQANGDVYVAWSNNGVGTNDYVYVYDGQEYKIPLNLGRIGGLEFSPLDPDIIYVSCPDTGIVALDYTTANYTFVPNSEDFGHTFLQTAPDGNIYGVQDGGYILGQINIQEGGNFYPDYLLLNSYYFVSTCRMFEGTRYYILPENHRTYDPLIVTVDTIPETCPGDGDGEAIICVSGGTPGTPPDPVYNITCIDPNGNSIDYDEYDPATGCFHYKNLTAGKYYFYITDDIGTPYNGSFIIGDTYYDAKVIVVENDMSWDDLYSTPYRIEFLLRVENNAVLDIDYSTLEFGPNGKVIIEPGSRINADNSVFRNLDCEPYEKWLGIEVWGDENTHQYAYPDACAQGYLYLNNSTVMHAENGVALWAEEDRLWNTAGGIVKAVQSDFIDNTRAVHFVPYENYYPYEPYDACNNLSSFKLCDFILDTDYIDNTTFYKHVDLHGVNGIGFYGCNFSLTASSGVSQWNNGIASYGSGFKVDEGCMPPCFSYEPSTFEGFYRAVSAHGNNANDYTYEIWNSVFTNNVIGIYNTEVFDAVMVADTFLVGYNGTTDNTNCTNASGIGIEIIGALGYAIEDNYFAKLQGAPLGNYVGVRLDSTRSEGDIIYRNEYYNLSVGTLSEKNNRSDWEDDWTGVTYICNTNSNNNYDIHVADSSKIRGYVGSTELASGNTLSQNSILQIRNDYTEDIRYYYYVGDPLQWLTLYSNYVIPDSVLIENTCPDHYGGGVGVVISTTQKALKEQEYNQNMADYNLTLDLYNTLKDGGDTPLMETEIETAWPDEMWDLRATLLANSPHLSFEVLKDVADRTDVFPESVQFEIFSANPDEMNYDFLTYLETKAQPMSQYMVDMLWQVGYGSSYKTVLKNQLSNYYGEAIRAAQDILRSELCDSITDLNEVRLWLNNIGGYQSDKQIIASYLQEGDISSAQSLLSQLPALHDLSGDALLEYSDYNTMMQLQISLLQEGRNIFELDSTELTTVNYLADYGYGSSKIQARGILEYAYGQHYYNCPELPDSLTLKRYDPNITYCNEDEVIQVSVKPNPAHTWLAFDYTLPFSSKEGVFRIIDMTGHCIKNIQLYKNTGQKVVDVRIIPAGVYIYKIESAGYSTSGKLIIQ